jgi:SnoaL-like polyketide cyclase
MKHAFPDLQAKIEDIFAAQDKVAVRLRLHGTHSGEFLGFGPTGRTVEYVSHEFYRIARGLIAEEWICSDTATLLRQLSGLSMRVIRLTDDPARTSTRWRCGPLPARPSGSPRLAPRSLPVVLES